jgi:Xaa-Pro aminopeptidase
LLVDWGADVLYKSDITRTLINPQGANPSRRNKHERAGYKFDEIYRVVQKAHEAAVAVIRHGVAAKEVDAAARKVISDAGYGKFFTHGLGHGIGLEIHEAPRVRANSEDILQAGMVITIEPGIYISGQNDPKGKDLGGWGGVRLEDDYLVTKEGSRRLTTLPHDPKAIE